MAVCFVTGGNGFLGSHLIEALSARQNVEMALFLHDLQSRREVRERAEAMLDSVGLGDRMDHHPSAMSGGQRWRRWKSTGLSRGCPMRSARAGNRASSSAPNWSGS